MINVPMFDATGEHAWAEVFERDSDGVRRLTGYCCQKCAEVIAPYTVICPPGEESRYTAHYGAGNVIASPHTGLSSGEAYEIDGRISAGMMYCRGR